MEQGRSVEELLATPTKLEVEEEMQLLETVIEILCTEPVCNVKNSELRSFVNRVSTFLANPGPQAYLFTTASWRQSLTAFLLFMERERAQENIGQLAMIILQFVRLYHLYDDEELIDAALRNTWRLRRATDVASVRRFLLRFMPRLDAAHPYRDHLLILHGRNTARHRVMPWDVQTPHKDHCVLEIYHYFTILRNSSPQRASRLLAELERLYFSGKRESDSTDGLPIISGCVPVVRKTALPFTRPFHLPE